MKNIISDLVSLPERFYNLKNDKSIYALLQDTGYFEIHNNVKENELENYLIQFPEYICQWKEWSENKRTSSGWYFNEEDENNYSVIFFDLNKNIKKNLKYTDIIKACAAYIKIEIDSIRLS